MSTSNEIALRWMPPNTFDDKATMVQISVFRQQAITWANVDPDMCHRMVSLGHDRLIMECN